MSELPVLAKIALPKVHTGVRPVDAASLIVIDHSGRKPRVLMGKRHHGHSFMPGYVVFPGGRVEAADRVMRVYGALQDHTERRLMVRVDRPSSIRARALSLCALRETYEETGLMIGESGLGAPDAPSPAWSAFAEHSIYPALDELHFVARAVTPPGFPRRFDTRFFAVDAERIAMRVEGRVGPDAELVETMWLTFEEARRAAIAQITRTILETVADRLSRGLRHDWPVPYLSERHGRLQQGEV